MTTPVVKGNRGGDSVPRSLLRRVRQNDTLAWERLVGLCTPLISSWCQRAGLQEADAADVGQEVFRAVHRSIGRFHSDTAGESFCGWLRTITRNKLRDLVRQRRELARGGDGRLEQLPSPEGAEPDTGVTDAYAASLRRRVESIRSGFSAQHWEAFLLVIVAGQTARQAGDAVGLTENAVALAGSRIRKRFREEFGDLLGERGAMPARRPGRFSELPL